MISCPYCGSEIIEGADTCDECLHPLSDLSFPMPETSIEKGLLKDRIAILNPKTPLCVSPDALIADVLNQMTDKSYGCVMVVENDALIGIFSEYDALMKINTSIADYANRAVSSVMTPNPITLESKDKIAFALHKMHVGGYRHLPIMDNNNLAGVISIRDILRYLSEGITAEAS